MPDDGSAKRFASLVGNKSKPEKSVKPEVFAEGWEALKQASEEGRHFGTSWYGHETIYPHNVTTDHQPGSHTIDVIFNRILTPTKVEEWTGIPAVTFNGRRNNLAVMNYSKDSKRTIVSMGLSHYEEKVRPRHPSLFPTTHHEIPSDTPLPATAPEYVAETPVTIIPAREIAHHTAPTPKAPEKKEGQWRPK